MRRDQHPEPFWRAARHCWYVQLGKKQLRLHPDRDEAYRRYHEILSRKPEEQAPQPHLPSRLVVELLDAFLDWAKTNKAPHTYIWYKANIQRFVDAIPAGLTIAELKPYHVTRATDAHTNWANNTRLDFITAVKRAFNWAVDEEIIDRSPLARVRKPAREAREMAVSPSEYAGVIAAASEPNFRDLLEMAWETGARVQELRKIEAVHVDPDNSRIVLPPSRTKGKKRYRVIYLGTDRARELVRRLTAEKPEGTLLTNSEGRPWTKDAINCAFCRLEKKIGKKFHLGAFRKGFTTEGLKNGVDTVTMAHLLGHRDASMVSRVYGRVQQDPAFMAEAARRAKGAKPNGDA